MAYTYILFSEKLNKYYVGSTLDVNQRLSRHNRGTEKFTSTGIPWKIVYVEQCDTVSLSRKREIEIKKKKSRKYIEWLIQNKSLRIE
jgi:putative endonuclease